MGKPWGRSLGGTDLEGYNWRYIVLPGVIPKDFVAGQGNVSFICKEPAVSLPEE